MLWSAINALAILDGPANRSANWGSWRESMRSNRFAWIDSQKNPDCHNTRAIRANRLKIAIRSSQRPETWFATKKVEFENPEMGKSYEYQATCRFARIRGEWIVTEAQKNHSKSRSIKNHCVYECFIESSGELLPASLWNESGTRQKLFRKTFSDELFNRAWIFYLVGFLGNKQNTVSWVLFRKRELTEFCGELGEFCEKLGKFGHANNRLNVTHWVRSTELSEPWKTHWVRYLKPYFGQFPREFLLLWNQCACNPPSWFHSCRGRSARQERRRPCRSKQTWTKEMLRHLHQACPCEPHPCCTLAKRSFVAPLWWMWCQGCTLEGPRCQRVAGRLERKRFARIALHPPPPTCKYIYIYIYIYAGESVYSPPFSFLRVSL